MHYTMIEQKRCGRLMKMHCSPADRDVKAYNINPGLSKSNTRGLGSLIVKATTL